jgi:hypothetical protein
MSWWVGKDREAFNVALHEHTERIMRTGDKRPPRTPSHAPTSPPADVAVIEAAPIPEPTPPVAEAPPVEAPKNVRRRLATPRRRRRTGRERLALATTLRRSIEATDEARQDPALGIAAVVMIGGFLLGQRLGWISAWSHVSEARLRPIIANLCRYGVWGKDGTIAGRWCNVYFSGARSSKAQRCEADMAFWMDAMVAKGELTREQRGVGQFWYGLREWES